MALLPTNAQEELCQDGTSTNPNFFLQKSLVNKYYLVLQTTSLEGLAKRIWKKNQTPTQPTVPEFPESPFSRLDFESETDQSWTSSPIPSPILTWFEHRDRFRVRFRVLSRETRYFESETPIFHIKPVEISPNFKAETRESLTSSPIPSLRLGYP